ncbi:MAG: hypothetical protein NVS2B9_16790 [Myxococcales bacterium]
MTSPVPGTWLRLACALAAGLGLAASDPRVAADARAGAQSGPQPGSAPGAAVPPAPPARAPLSAEDAALVREMALLERVDLLRDLDLFERGAAADADDEAASPDAPRNPQRQP